jgi:hypothetical protein
MFFHLCVNFHTEELQIPEFLAFDTADAMLKLATRLTGYGAFHWKPRYGAGYAIRRRIKKPCAMGCYDLHLRSETKSSS